jgi:hypothetical protein
MNHITAPSVAATTPATHLNQGGATVKCGDRAALLADHQHERVAAAAEQEGASVARPPFGLVRRVVCVRHRQEDLAEAQAVTDDDQAAETRRAPREQRLDEAGEEPCIAFLRFAQPGSNVLAALQNHEPSDLRAAHLHEAARDRGARCFWATHVIRDVSGRARSVDEPGFLAGASSSA